MTWPKPHWAYRTIIDGKVRIERRTFVPSDQWLKYDGRLDGMRYLFGIYRDTPDGPAKPFVNLWGPEGYAKLDPESPEAETYPRPEIVDGYFPWNFFNEEIR